MANAVNGDASLANISEDVDLSDVVVDDESTREKNDIEAAL